MSSCKHDKIMVFKHNIDTCTPYWQAKLLKHNNHSIFSNPGDENVSMCPNTTLYTPLKLKVAATFK